jgi:cell division septation protein DedD
MSIDVNRYVNHLLLKRGVVTLQGIGTIREYRIPAMLTMNKEKVNPPKSGFEFKETFEDGETLIEIIAEQEKVKKETAVSEVKSFCEDLLNKLVNYHIVKVADIGYLENKESKIHFIPSEAALNNKYFGLPSIPLKPIRKVAAPVISTAPIATNIIRKPDGSQMEWFNYLASLILGALLILAYHYFLDPLPLKSDTKMEKLAEVSAVPQKEEVSTPVPVETDEVMDSTVSDSENESTAEVALSENESSDVKVTEEDSANVVIAKPKDETECIIIVGVFTRTINALELSDRLERGGYTPYLENVNDTQRVGVRFRCADHDLKEYITNIRKRYSRRAWYLVPQVSI